MKKMTKKEAEARGLKCVAGICRDPKTGRIVVEIEGSCPDEAVEEIFKGVAQGPIVVRRSQKKEDKNGD